MNTIHTLYVCVSLPRCSIQKGSHVHAVPSLSSPKFPNFILKFCIVVTLVNSLSNAFQASTVSEWVSE